MMNQMGKNDDEQLSLVASFFYMGTIFFMALNSEDDYRYKVS